MSITPSAIVSNNLPKQKNTIPQQCTSQTITLSDTYSSTQLPLQENRQYSQKFTNRQHPQTTSIDNRQCSQTTDNILQHTPQIRSIDNRQYSQTTDNILQHIPQIRSIDNIQYPQTTYNTDDILFEPTPQTIIEDRQQTTSSNIQHKQYPHTHLLEKHRYPQCHPVNQYPNNLKESV